MNDQDALAALADALRREERARPSEWDKVAHGRMTVEDAAAAREAAGDDPEDIERAKALFAPLEETAEAALADRLAAIAIESAPQPVDDEAPTTAAVVRPDPAVWQRRLAYGAIAVAAAGVLVWAVRPPTDGEPAPKVAVAAPLPTYDAVVQPGRAAARAAADSTVQLGVGAPFSVLLRPASRHEQPARATLCLRDGAGNTRHLDVRQAPGAPGETLDVSASVPADATPGPWTMISIVSGGDLGDEPCRATAAESTKVVETAVEIVP